MTTVDRAMTVVDAAVSRVFGSLSRLRRSRVFHPRGYACAATVTIAVGDHPLRALSGEYDGIVRLSRGVGLREPLPDVLGIAVRIVAAHGRERHQDFLLATSATGFFGRRLLLPAIRSRTHRYSSVLPYDNGDGRHFLVGATFADGDGEIALDAATGREGWVPVGRVQIGHRLTTGEADALQFTPWHTGGAIMPVGVLNRLRLAAYAASQRARPDTGPHGVDSLAD